VAAAAVVVMVVVVRGDDHVDQEGCRQSSEFKEMYSSIKREK